MTDLEFGALDALRRHGWSELSWLTDDVITALCANRWIRKMRGFPNVFLITIEWLRELWTHERQCQKEAKADG